MKRFFMVVLLFAFAMSLNNYLIVKKFNSERDRLEAEISSLYFLSTIHSRQIRTLQNYEMRRENPDIQKRLKIVRDSYFTD